MSAELKFFGGANFKLKVVLLGFEPRLGESESPVIAYYTIRPDSIVSFRSTDLLVMSQALFP